MFDPDILLHVTHGCDAMLCYAIPCVQVETGGVLGVNLARQLKMTQDAMCVRYSNTKSQVSNTTYSVLSSIPLSCWFVSFLIHLFAFFISRFLAFFHPHPSSLTILCAHQDKLLVAVGLLDCTVKIFFDDTLKFFLSLYGHKLPVLCLDISYDGNILISGSADKTVKIWGLDFGDCHR
jgi:WD40 repeat protein